MKSGRLWFLVFALAVAGCASIEGTRDKSATVVRTPTAAVIDSVAVLPIKEYAAVQGLSSQIAAALPQGIVKSIPHAAIVDAPTFSERLSQAGLVQAYGQWESAYESTSILDARQIPQFGKATGAHYLLLVRSVYLNREKINPTAAGYSGVVQDANNVWRTDLKASAELLDATDGRLVWKGTAHAENISSKKKDLDLYLVIVNRKNPEISDYIAQMIQTLADGLGNQIAGGGKAGG